MLILLYRYNVTVIIRDKIISFTSDHKDAHIINVLKYFLSQAIIKMLILLINYYVIFSINNISIFLIAYLRIKCYGL